MTSNLITAELLVKAKVTHERAERWFPYLQKAATLYDINNRARVAMFLAQICHESGNLQWVKELWGPTRTQTRYEGRKDLGNTEPGDGKRFRGRGLIQVTGRYNYRALTQRLHALGSSGTPRAEALADYLNVFDPGATLPDFEADPSLLEQPLWAALSAGDYWDRENLNPLSDQMALTLVTRRINGGLNGLKERKALWNTFLAAIPRT